MNDESHPSASHALFKTCLFRFRCHQPKVIMLTRGPLGLNLTAAPHIANLAKIVIDQPTRVKADQWCLQ